MAVHVAVSEQVDVHTYAKTHRPSQAARTGGQRAPAHLQFGERDTGAKAGARNLLRIGLELGALLVLRGCLRPLLQRRQHLYSSRGDQDISAEW
jgi:hypothetical protein